MQISVQNIIITVVIVTAMLLVAAGFLLAYVNIYNKRKRRHIEEKYNMQHTFTQQLLQAQLEMQEQTFNTVSEEIHDNVGQLLSLASIQLSMAIKKNAPPEYDLSTIKESVDNALNDLRNIARNLNGGYLEQLTILQFLERSREQISRSAFIACQVEITGEEAPLPVQKKIILFRILQECFQNVIKHASAGMVRIEVFFDAASLKVIFKDNGKGFSPKEQEAAGVSGIGLRNMQNRAQLINGILLVESKPNEGTAVLIHIPYET